MSNKVLWMVVKRTRPTNGRSGRGRVEKNCRQTYKYTNN